MLKLFFGSGVEVAMEEDAALTPVVEALHRLPDMEVTQPNPTTLNFLKIRMPKIQVVQVEVAAQIRHPKEISLKSHAKFVADTIIQQLTAGTVMTISTRMMKHLRHWLLFP